MEILFTHADGKRLQWDGMLWSSPENPGTAVWLNGKPLPCSKPQGRILERTRQQAEEQLGPVEMRAVDLTGMPEENYGGDVISADDGLGKSFRAPIALADSLESKQSPPHD